jgi:rare lipoprotein A
MIYLIIAIALNMFIYGKASWYGEPFHGRTTASGEKYDMNDYTAAHRTLKFGTVVRVWNVTDSLDSHYKDSIDVRITDRGAFHKYGRILDLSKAAFDSIAWLGTGVIDVKYKIIKRSKK